MEGPLANPTIISEAGPEALSDDKTIVSAAELIELCAIDRELFCTTFFPRTARQAMPKFAQRMWDLFESSSRFVMIEVFRGGAKTSNFRMFAAKRIAYGTSRTVVLVGKSEAHALASTRWLRKHIENPNSLYAKVFSLTPGDKWQDHHFEIKHALRQDEYGNPLTITVLGIGITGSTRGINIEDFRPDLILLDDICDLENSATPEQRNKIEQTVFGSLQPSLAPEVDSPEAKMIGLQTPLDREDYAEKAFRDPAWAHMRISCWTQETENLASDEQESAWPERYSTRFLRQTKQDFIGRNQLSIWMREYECKITSPETSAFIANWLRFYDVAPPGLVVFSGIDPVPPPSEKQIKEGLRNKDYEAFVSIGRAKDNYYLLGYDLMRGHEPGWTISTFFKHGLTYHPRKWVVESVAYQRTLVWILRQAMLHQKQWFVIQEFEDRRTKYNRILDGVSGLASNGRLYVKREHMEFISQFSGYPNISHDDLIDAVAMVLLVMSDSAVMFEEEDFETEDENKIASINYRGAQLAP